MSADKDMMMLRFKTAIDRELRRADSPVPQPTLPDQAVDAPAKTQPAKASPTPRTIVPTRSK